MKLTKYDRPLNALGRPMERPAPFFDRAHPVKDECRRWTSFHWARCVSGYGEQFKSSGRWGAITAASGVEMLADCWRPQPEDTAGESPAPKKTPGSPRKATPAMVEEMLAEAAKGPTVAEAMRRMGRRYPDLSAKYWRRKWDKIQARKKKENTDGD